MVRCLYILVFRLVSIQGLVTEKATAGTTHIKPRGNVANHTHPLFGDCIFKPKLQAYQPSLASLSFPFHSIDIRRMPSRMHEQSRTGQAPGIIGAHDLSVMFWVHGGVCSWWKSENR